MPEVYDNEVVLILITSTALLLILSVILILALLIQQRRKHIHLQQLTDMQNQYEKTLLQSELKVQEETLRAISENLHDNIGSNISTTMLLLYKDEQISREEEEANRQEALSMLSVIVDDLKDISRSLNSNYLEEIGLNEAVRHRMSMLDRLKKYEIELYLGEAPCRLNRQKQLFLFYIFQEAINNINKHARAKKIKIMLVYGKDKLMMQITDDGVGIASSQKKENDKGSGLINMKNHATMMNAALDINRQDPGTEIIVTVPDPYL